VPDLERITVPFFGQDSLEREHSVLYSHSAETLNYCHPSAANNICFFRVQVFILFKRPRIGAKLVFRKNTKKTSFRFQKNMNY
jgi:hypothetical protein